MEGLGEKIQTLERVHALKVRKVILQDELATMQNTLVRLQESLRVLDNDIQNTNMSWLYNKKIEINEWTMKIQALETHFSSIYRSDGYIRDPAHPHYGHRTWKGHREHAGIFPQKKGFLSSKGEYHPTFKSAKRKRDQLLETSYGAMIVDMQALMDEAARCRIQAWNSVRPSF